MRTVTIEHQVYGIEDLSDNPEVRQAVLTVNYDWEVQKHGWRNPTYDAFKTSLKGTCFICDKISFSGFSSQGDGAMFEGSFLLDYTTELSVIELYVPDKRIARLIKAERISISCDFRQYGNHSHHKSYTNTFVVETYGNHRCDDNICNYLDSGTLESKIKDDYETLCKDLYRDLESEYEYLTSDKYLLDMFKENEYEFYADGSIYDQ